MYCPLLLATLALLCLPLAAEPRLATLEYPPYSSQAQAAGIVRIGLVTEPGEARR